MVPHAPGRARPKCRFTLLAEPPAGRSWAAPGGASWHMVGAAPPPPLEGAGVVVHEKTVAQRQPHMGRRPQAPYLCVPAVSRQAHKL